MDAHVFLVSTLVYLVVNVVENLVHYNIGKHTGKRFAFTRPTAKDALMMGCVMVGAALAQGAIVAWVA